MKSFAGCPSSSHHPWLFPLAAVVLCCILSAAGVCQPPPPVDVAGTVSLPNGAPAEKATVEIFGTSDWSKLIAVIGTDAAGHFSLILPPGSYYLRARRDTLVYEHPEPLQVGMGGIATPLEIALAPGCSLTGKLIDASTGKPLAGAQILLRDRMSVTTNEDGAFDCGVLPRGRYTLAVQKAGFAYAVTTVSADRDAVQLALETKPEGVVKGRVTNTQGEPVPGARVGPPGQYFDFQQATTNADGVYTLSGFDPDLRISELTAFVDGYDYSRKGGILFQPGQRIMTVDFQLNKTKKQETRDITGQVKAVDGKPVFGARIAYGFGVFFEDYRSTTSDGDGKYTLNGVSAAQSLVAVQADGYAPVFQVVKVKANMQLDFTLPSGHRVEGRIVDEDGNPLAGFHVSAGIQPPELDQLGMFQWTYVLEPKTMTDAEGHFRLDSLPAGKVLIDAYGPGDIRLDAVPLAVDRNDQRIEIPKRLQVSGTVVSAVDGTPITGFTIGDEYHEKGTAFTTPDGTFTLTNTRMTRGGKMMLTVEAPGYCRAYQLVEAKSAKEADPTGLVIRLKPAVTFTGTVTGKDTGKVLDGVLVTVLDTTLSGGISSFRWSEIPEAWRPISARTDAGGHFHLDAVPIRYGAVLLEKVGYGRQLLPDVNLGKPLQIGMEPGATITGNALDDTGKPRTDAFIEVSTPDGVQSFDTDLDADGKFRVSNLAPGEYLISQTYGEKIRKIITATAHSGEQYRVEWNQPGEAVLEGVVMHHGQPVAGASLLLYPGNQSMYDALGESGKDGAFRLVVPKTGEHFLMMSLGEWGAPDHVDVKSLIDIRPGNNRLQVELPGAQVSGQVIDRTTGKPLAGVSLKAYAKQTDLEHFVRVYDPFSMSLTPRWFSVSGAVRTDGDGRFILRNLHEGEWLIALSNDTGGGIPSQSFTVGRDEKKEVMVEIPPVGTVHLAIIDAATGKPIPDMAAICLDAQGFWFTLERARGMAGYGPQLTPDGKMIFTNLPAGRYLAYSAGMSESAFDYPVASVAFEVKAGETADVILPVKRGGRLVFQLRETEDDRMPGNLWVGVKVSTPDGRPALEDHSGLHPGDRVPLGGEAPRRGILALRPGTYVIDAVLGYDVGRNPAETYRWRGTQTITIEDGKDVLIEIP